MIKYRFLFVFCLLGIWSERAVMAAGTVRIVSPENLSIHRSGEREGLAVRVEVVADDNTQCQRVSLYSPELGLIAGKTEPPYIFSVSRAPSSTWTDLVAICAKKDDGNVMSAPVTIGLVLESGGIGQDIQVRPSDVRLRWPGDQATVDVFSFSTSGTARRRITLTRSPSIQYKSSNEAVVSVSRRGVVTGVSPGSAEVQIASGAQSKKISVTVEGSATGDLDGDGKVRESDIDEVALWVGQKASTASDARDINRDGSIDDADVMAFRKLCGMPCGGTGVSEAVPARAIVSAPAATLPPSEVSSPRATSVSTIPGAIVPPKQSTSPNPVVAAPTVYRGPSSGTLIWSGQPGKDGLIRIEGNQVSIGALRGDFLPGVLVQVKVEPAEIVPSKAPAASNGFKGLELRTAKKQNMTVMIRWTVIQ